MKKVILASASQRRRDLIKKIVPVFEVVIPDVPETDDPVENAVLKARSVYRHNLNAIVVAADTVVKIDNEIFGKPKNRDEAFNMLKKLSANVHTVETGVCVISSEGEFKGLDRTLVAFDSISDSEIRHYIESNNIFDKAGAYAIQDSAEVFIKYIKGSYSNVVGLPLNLTYNLMKKAGFVPYKWVKIGDIASVVRSKNAGPFEITFDIMFDKEDYYNRFKNINFLNKETFSRLYDIPYEEILVFEYFDSALALKITIKRNIPCGSPGDMDVYGAQLYLPLSEFLIPWEPIE